MVEVRRVGVLRSTNVAVAVRGGVDDTGGIVHYFVGVESYQSIGDHVVVVLQVT